jgi:phospholipid transport system substrate-binding protein
MLKKLILVWLLSVVFLYAIEEQAIKQVMDTKVSKVLTILKDNTLSQHQKEQKCIAVIDDVFDYDIMAQISLGRKWGSFTKNERAQFSKRFEQKLKLSYLDKLRLYNNERVIIKEVQKVKPTRSTLETLIIGRDDTYKVIYLFYKKKQNSQWYIYDVNLVGVSILQTYRKQFSEFLQTKTPMQLIESL